MSSNVVLVNQLDVAFKLSIISFSENEANIDQFWIEEYSGPIKGNDKLILGKLKHPDSLPASVNFVVSIILKPEELGDTDSKENLIILKIRIKGSKTGSKLYSCVASYPDSKLQSIWSKGSSKNCYLTQFLSKYIKIDNNISWSNNITFSIIPIDEIPVIFRFQNTDEDCVIDDVYENQWKSKCKDISKYTHHPLTLHNHRPPFSTACGKNVLPKSHIMPPNPNWKWEDDWHVDDTFKNVGGWVYTDEWLSCVAQPEFSTKFRFRRWIRTRSIKNRNKSSEFLDLSHVLIKFKHKVDYLNSHMPPFLKEVEEDVKKSPNLFDFGTIAAVPSPKLRRKLGSYK